MSRAPALQASGIRKRYGTFVALDGVDLWIEPGEILGLVGPNGAGKTTLIGIAAGLLRPDAGAIHLAGVDVAADPAAARRLVGLAPQRLGIHPTLTVAENLAFFARLAGRCNDDARRRAKALAGALGLSAVLDRRAGRLSGGEQRRLHVACGLAGQPALLLLDEPTAGADPPSRRAMGDVVREAAAAGTAVCYATHQLDEVEALDGSVAVLHRGRVVAGGTVRSVIAEHARPHVELAFDGPAPALPDEPGMQYDGETIRLPAPDPGAVIARVLREAGPAAARLRSVEITRPGLDAVFAAVTGEAYPPNGGGSARGDASA